MPFGWYYFKFLWDKSFSKLSLLCPIQPFRLAGEASLLSLVLLAAEDEGRTEEPTERRREKEREKGRVPKSAEIPQALVGLGAILALFFTAQWVLSRLAALVRLYVGQFHSLPRISDESLMNLLIFLSKETALILLPVFLVAMLLAIAGNVMQTGFLFSLHPLKPDFSRIALSWRNFVQRVFFSRQVAVNLIKTMGKVVILSVVSYAMIAGDFVAVLKTPAMGIGEALRLLGFSAFKLALVLAIILLVFSVPDYFYQRYEFRESLKMTKQEVKEELRETEGDPLVRQRQRQMQYAILRRSMLQAVKEADVVITNPTHYAVALQYLPERDRTPRVIAKGADHMAMRIRQLAQQYDIMVVPSPYLARALYYSVPLNQEVPQEMITTLAAIYREVYRAKELKSKVK
ncbi:MAG: flagellar biosynthesis protein FlhB [Leptospiraceae bacterium]|nr:flagellar biosynthesis protein FlhB [Leptospiraceae bacterium]MDW8306642.1 flagellar biosynthesis protein FlhB [Leptospiraceae bacterium]